MPPSVARQYAEANSPSGSNSRNLGSPLFHIEGIASLHTFPNRGRLGRVDGTREFVFAPLPFVAVYELHGDLQVLRILHGAQTVAANLEPRTLPAHLPAGAT
jgi:hypothetical protein